MNLNFLSFKDNIFNISSNNYLDNGTYKINITAKIGFQSKQMIWKLNLIDSCLTTVIQDNIVITNITATV